MGFFSPKKPAEQPYERARREKIQQITQCAQQTLGHYLASPFTAQCVSILRAEIAVGRILRNETDRIKIDTNGRGIVAGYLGYPELINFNEYGYNNLSGAKQKYGFLFAICQLLGSDYAIGFEEHPFFDHLEPYIVRKEKAQHYNDI